LLKWAPLAVLRRIRRDLVVEHQNEIRHGILKYSQKGRWKASMKSSHSTWKLEGLEKQGEEICGNLNESLLVLEELEIRHPNLGEAVRMKTKGGKVNIACGDVLMLGWGGRKAGIDKDRRTCVCQRRGSTKGGNPLNPRRKKRTSKNKETAKSIKAQGS